MREFPGRNKGGRAIAYHPAGRALLAADAEELAVRDLDGGGPTHTWVGLRGGVARIQFEPAGDTVALVGRGGDVELRRWPDGAVLQQYRSLSPEPIEGLNDGPSPSRLGRQLSQVAYRHEHRVAVGVHDGSQAGRNHHVVFWRCEAPSHRQLLRSQQAVFHGLDLSPDATLVAASSWSKRVVIVECASGKHRLTWSPGQEVAAVRFVAAGRLLAAVGHRVVLYDVPTAKVLAAVAGHTGGVTSLAWSPDLRTVLSVGLDDTVGVTHLPAAHLARRYALDADPLSQQAVALAPDGCTFATIDRRGAVRLWDLDG